MVEGQTEEAFVKRVLAPHFEPLGIYLTVVIVETSRAASGAKRRGGGGNWSHYERDILKLLNASHFAMVTMLLDFYAYPSNAPGADCAKPHQPRECAQARQDALAASIGDPRFRPFVLLHEFETLVFAAASGRSSILGLQDAAQALGRELDEFGGDPELLDDSPDTAPSKRIARVSDLLK